MKIIIASNGPHVSSGYGVPTRHVAQFLKNIGHDVAIQAFYGVQGNTLNWNGITLYPAQGARYGVDCIGAQARHFGAKLVITLMDNWCFPDDYNSRFDAPWLQWFPVDGEPLPEKSKRMALSADYPAVFSRHGVHTANAAGVEVSYLPYGVDCDMFKPANKFEARKALGIPCDIWLAVTVAANKGYPARKAWPEIVGAFSRFAKGKDDVRLYLHTRKSPISELGVHFEPLIAAHPDIHGKVSFVNQGALAVGVDNDDLAALYQAADVMLLPSMGEGFGLPIAEAQACGCPVITQACSSMPELTVNGICIEAGQPFWVPILNYWWHTPRIEDIVDALEQMYLLQGSDEQRNQSRRGVAHFQAEYHWPVVFSRYWMPLLKKIESEMW